MEKPLTQLSAEDLAGNPVWDYYEDTNGLIAVSPVQRVPVNTLQGRLIGCRVRLSNGQRVWAQLSNIDLKNQIATSHFLLIAIERSGKWFHLARYFDVDYSSRGPKSLAQFLDLPINEVFPISYDIGPYVSEAQIATVGELLEEPPTRLSGDELIALSLE